MGSHLLHHASVAAIGISPNDRFVASAGGQDDPSILIWDIDAKTPVCGKTILVLDFSLIRCIAGTQQAKNVAIYISYPNLKSKFF